MTGILPQELPADKLRSRLGSPSRPPGGQDSGTPQLAQVSFRGPRTSRDIDPSSESLDLLYRHGPATSTGVPIGPGLEPGQARRAWAKTAAVGGTMWGLVEGLWEGPRRNARRAGQVVNEGRDARGSWPAPMEGALNGLCRGIGLTSGLLTGPVELARERGSEVYRRQLYPRSRTNRGRQKEVVQPAGQRALPLISEADAS